MVLHNTSEDLLLVPKMFGEWSPQVVKGFVFNPLLLVLGVDPGKPPCFETHVCEKPWISRGMTERINMPSDVGLHIEFLLKKLVSYQHIVDHIFIMWGRLIVHAPTSINKLESSL